MVTRYIELVTYIQIALWAAFTVMLIFFPSKPNSSFIKFVGFNSFLSFVAGITFILIEDNEYILCVQTFHALYFVINLGTLFLIYYYAGQRRSRLFWITFVSYTVVTVTNLFLFPESPSPHIITQIIGSVIISILSISYFYKLLKELPVVNIQTLAMFWFNAGIFIYHIGTLGLLIIALNRGAADDTNIIQLFDSSLGIIRQLTIIVFIYFYLKN